MNINRLRFLPLFFLLSCICGVTAGDEFTHPGIAHSRASIDFVKGKIAVGQQPWATAWKSAQASRYADLDWSPKPRAHVERGAYNNPNIGSSEFSADADAAYVHALNWALSDSDSFRARSESF